MKKLHDKLSYYPVNTLADPKALSLCDTCLTNALRRVSPGKLNEIRKKDGMADSGGYQIYSQGLNKGKDVLIGSIYENLLKDPDFLTIGFLSNCQEYRRLNSNIGFCVDIPIDPNDSDYKYYYIMNETIIARNHMLEIAKQICPKTNMAIVLHPRTPLEIEDYFGLMSTPEISIYAYPASNKPSDALGNAYVLSFLHSVGVRHVHFLGSSAVPIIALLAQAVVLDLFARCSFDSLTWNQPGVRQGYRYLSPETLKSMPKKEPLRPDMNLRWVLRSHEKFLFKFKKRFEPPQFMLVKEWLGTVNIQAIEYYKNRMLDKLSTPGSSRQIFSNDKKFAHLIAAVNLLHESKYNGHDFVREKYGQNLNKFNGIR